MNGRGLLVLLLVVLVLIAGAAVAYWFLTRPTDQDKAVAAVEKLGGKAEVDATQPGKPVIAVDLRGKEVTDEDLEQLKHFPQLQKLDLSVTKITDAGLATVGGLTQLQGLDLSGTQITDEGLQHLKGLKQLRTLKLNLLDHVTDAGLDHLKGMTQLRELEAGSRGFTKKGIKKLEKALPRLKVRDRE
jgi:hypothetical protein